MATILITGATGFLGSHLLEEILVKGYDVVVLKRSASNISRIEHLLPKVTTIDVNVDGIEAAFRNNAIDIVIHTACDYGRSKSTTSAIVDTNLMFSLQILEQAAIHGVKTFINTGSLLPKNVNTYSLSKAQFEEWMKLFSKSIQCVNIRLEHMYGVNDDDKKFVPWLIGKMLDGEDKIKLTSGEQLRDFIYIDDVVSVFTLILRKLEDLPAMSEFDVFSGNLITVKEFILKLANEIEQTFGREIVPRLEFGAIEYRENDVMVPEFNKQPLLDLGWKADIPVSMGIKRIVEEIS